MIDMKLIIFFFFSAMGAAFSFNEIDENHLSLPDSYSSVSLVGPARNQGQNCGDCVLFATMALVEICHARTFGHLADYSEQQLFDCAYNPGQDIDGCTKADVNSYAKWLQNTRTPLVSERTYPFHHSLGQCRRGLNPLKPSVIVTKFKYSQRVHDRRQSRLENERKMKRLVIEYGAVGTNIAPSELRHYKGGVFSGCPRRDYEHLDHMVAVVGYGTERGMDYWLVRNSW